MNHSIKRFILSVAWVIVVTWEPRLVNADQIFQVRDYDVVIGSVIVPVNLVFNQFNPQFGRLLNIGFLFQFDVRSASIDFENTAPSPGVGFVEINKIVNYVGPGLVTGGNIAL